MTSVWWPIHARPSSWFTAEQLEASARYHRPLQRVAVLRTVARFAGLISASLVCRNWLSVNDVWLLRLVAASGLATLAWWLPATASDWWFDRQHEPRFATATSLPSLPAHQLLTGSLVAGLGVFFGLMMVGGTIFGLITSAPQKWWMLATPLALLLALLVSFSQQRLAIRARSLEPLPDEFQLSFADMAKTAGVPGVSFWTMNSVLESGLNALTTGGGGTSERGLASQYRVAVTQGLLDVPLELQRVVVAHELAHIQSGHLKKTMLMGALSLVVMYGVVTLTLTDVELWFVLAGVEPGDPRGLPTLVLLIWLVGSGVGLVSAWLERAQERQADEGAFTIAGSVAGPDPGSVAGSATIQLMRAWHASEKTDLDPGLLSRLLSAHPPPAERLHRARLAAG